MKIVFTYENISFANAIRYSVEQLFIDYAVQLEIVDYNERDKFSREKLLISYGKAKPKSKNRFHIHIFESSFFSHTFLTVDSLPKTPLYRHQGLPIIYHNEDKTVKRKKNSLETNLDLVASTFFMVSRYEEFILTERDEFGRFRGKDSLAYKENFLHRPIVNEYNQLLISWIQDFGLSIEPKRHTGEYDFKICLTHDIDQLSGGWREAVFHEVNSASNPLQSLNAVGTIIWDRIFAKDVYWNLDQILDLEEEQGARSTFFFLPKTNNSKDAKYDFHKRKFLPVFDRMKKGVWEIGLHGSLNSVVDGNTLFSEKQSLEKVLKMNIDGIRQHFLRFNVSDSWHKQQTAGFGYDTSLGYVDVIGFRAGLAHPFHPYDFDAGKAHTIVEVPLVIMDSTLRQYEKLPPDMIWDRILPILDSVKQHKGAIAILWHNTYFTGHKFAGFAEIYTQILQWVKEEGGLLTTAKNVVETPD